MMMDSNIVVLRDVIRARVEEKYENKFTRLKTVPVMARICGFLIKNKHTDHNLNTLTKELGLTYMEARYYLRILIAIQMIKVYRVEKRANMYQMIGWVG